MNALTSKGLEQAAVMGGLVASSVLVDLTVSVWVGRKIDKKNTDKVVADNHAKSSHAALVTKNLFVGNQKLEDISKVANKIRGYVGSVTLPWMGDLRLLPMTRFLDFQTEMNQLEAEFNNAVVAFLTDYDLQVAAMAFKLGYLFQRAEYPSAEEIRGKFNMAWTVSPLPTSGDFRVDAERELREGLQRAYEQATQERIEASMKLMWGRLHDCLRHLVDRLGTTDGKPNVFRDSMLENAKELVNLLKDFNLAQDVEMERARQELHQLIEHVEPDDLRKNEGVRDEVRRNVSAILDKFAF